MPARIDTEISFIHLTDTHLGTADDSHLYSDTAATLDRVLDQIAGITPRPAFVVVSGDLTNKGDAARHRRLRDEMATTGLPVIYALGNHAEEGNLWGPLMAAATLVSLPILAVYAVLQRHVVSSFMRSGIVR